ncbi:MAG: hypothetical protein WBN42_00470 [Ignavibacteriaceae bacterium]
MADVAQTRQEVQLKSTASTEEVVAQNICVQGDFLYKNPAGNYDLAVCTDPLKDDVVAMALTPAAAALDKIVIAKPGCKLDVGAILTAAEEYVLSDNDGKIKARSALVSTEYYTRLGSGDGGGWLDFDPFTSGVQEP